MLNVSICQKVNYLENGKVGRHNNLWLGKRPIVYSCSSQLEMQMWPMRSHGEKYVHLSEEPSFCLIMIAMWKGTFRVGRTEFREVANGSY